MNEAATLLGIDLGTSGLKVALFDEFGRLLGQVYRESEYLDLPPGCREQTAEAWWQSLCSALADLSVETGASFQTVAGIGICGFHHCPVLLQRDGKSSRPVILLHDERLVGSREELEAAGTLATIETLTRSMVSAGHFPPIYHYVRTHDPDAIGRTRWILSAKDYLRFCLTGVVGTEICDATGTNLVEAGKRTWSDQLCEVLALDPSRLPEIGSSEAIAGYVTRDAAQQTGLLSGTPVVYGGGDSHCALLGLGCVVEGDTGLLLGTNSTLRTVFNGFVSHPQIKVWVQHHVIPEHYTVSASSMAGASVVHWFKDTFNKASSGVDESAYQLLERASARIPAGSEGLIFLPYIFGERVPFYDPAAKGAFIGIKHWHTKEHFLRSVLEGVALNIANCYEFIDECVRPGDVSPKPPRLAGGGSRMALWHQIIAECLNMPIHLMGVKEAGTLGAALLAGIGVGIYDSYHTAALTAVRQEATIEPTAANSEIYRTLRLELNEYYRRLQ